ncbi:MAG: zinc dependent phospholipase C family protein [Clostridiales bacterium]|jgi:hypothetical protein|nr:zinc dependent phospholipase C family protein [Clostridiales bacterium]
MPAIFTHYFFAKKIQLQSNNEIQNILNKRSEVFALGSQGPDFLFFNLINKKAAQLGGKIHHSKVNSFLRECVTRAVNSSGAERDILFSYLAGFICHYTLDTNAHPYIFYKSGFADKTGKTQGESAVRHRRLETAIDSMLCKTYTGKSPGKLNLQRRMVCAKGEKRVIARMYKSAVKAAYKERHAKFTYVLSMNMLTSFYTLFNDRSGLKKKMVEKLEKALNVPAYLSSMIHFSDILKYKEFLNLKKEPWFLPWDNQNAQFKSFPEIMEDARKNCLESVKILYDTVYNGADALILLYILEDLNFSTGLPCTENVDFIYTESNAL